MKKAAKKKRSSGTAVRRSVPRKSAAGKRPNAKKTTARPAAKRMTAGNRMLPATAQKSRGGNNPAAELARSALEAFDAGRLDKARRDIMTLTELLSDH